MKPFPLVNDNLGATQTVNNPDTRWRTRHLDVKYFKIRDYIKEMKLTVASSQSLGPLFVGFVFVLGCETPVSGNSLGTDVTKN